MRAVYEKLLYLYPTEFRREFSDEMAWCFSQASADCGGGFQRVQFLAREMLGLVRGACEAQLRTAPKLWKVSRRVVMISRNKRFRFPIAAIALMVATFAGILYAIRLARTVSYAFSGTQYVFRGQPYVYRPDHLSFVQTFGFAFGVTIVCTIAVLAILHVTRRAGVHRLADAQTWPRQ